MTYLGEHYFFFIFNVICDRTISAKNNIFTIFFLFSYILTTYNGVVVQIIRTDKMRNEITYYKNPRLIHFSFLYNIQVDTCISYAWLLCKQFLYLFILYNVTHNYVDNSLLSVCLLTWFTHVPLIAIITPR